MGYLNFNGTKIYYTVSGKGEPLLFLHGLFNDSTIYRGLIDILSNKYKVIVFDIPFHGKSGNLKSGPSPEGMSNIIKELLNQLKIYHPIICAHSNGALFAADYSSKNKIKKLLLINPLILNYHHKRFKILLNLILKMPLCNFFQNPIKEIKTYKVRIPNLFRMIFNKTFWNMFNKNMDEIYLSNLKKITCPIIIMWADNDGVVPIKYSKPFLINLKNSKLITIHGTHDWPIIKPAEINRYLNN